MAHTNSARKRARQNIKRQAANRAGKSLIKSLRRDLLKAVEAKDKTLIDKSVRAYASALDKSAKRGIINKNTAIRKKTRAFALVRTVA